MMMIDGEELIDADFFNGENQDQPVPPPEVVDTIDLQIDTVSTIYKCQSKNAKKLCIYDAAYKMKHTNNFDIGGTYTDSEHDVWFYFSTSACLGYNYLLNLFVCHRKVGNFSIGISNSNEFTLTHKKKTNEVSLPDSLTWHTFRSAQRNECHYIKTFCFSKNDVVALENNTLLIPITVNMDTPHSLDDDVIKRIKLSHDFGDLLSKQEKTDFVLESGSRKHFPLHKIILAAHSPVLRTMIQNTKSDSMFVDITDNDMELLLQFIYTGTIKDILKQDCLQLLQIADRFQLKSLFMLIQYALSAQINVENAVEIALVSEKYNLEELQFAAFDFMKNHNEVLETEGWKKLDNVDLAKKLFQHKLKRKAPSQ